MKMNLSMQGVRNPSGYMLRFRRNRDLYFMQVQKSYFENVLENGPEFLRKKIKIWKTGPAYKIKDRRNVYKIWKAQCKGFHEVDTLLGLIYKEYNSHQYALVFEKAIPELRLTWHDDGATLVVKSANKPAQIVFKIVSH